MCDLPWAVTFPAGSPPYESQVARGVMYGLVISGDPKASPVVQAVVPHSEAEQAGVRPDDRLKSLGGFDVESINIRTAGDAHRMLSYMFSEQKDLIVGLTDGRTLRLPAAAAPARSRPVHPTQLYSTIDAFLICLLLLAASPFCRRDGQVSALLLTVYPIARLLEESIRTDEAPIRGTGMTISQNVSVLLLLCAAGLWFYVWRQPPGRAYRRKGEPEA